MAPRSTAAGCGAASAALTVVQLRKQLKELGLSVAGSKLELVERLEWALAGCASGKALQPSEAGAGAPEAAPVEAAGAEGAGPKRKGPASPSPQGAAKSARLEGPAEGGAGEREPPAEPPAAKRPRTADQAPAGMGEDAGQSSTLSVKYAGKDQARSRNVCIRGLPSSFEDLEATTKLLLESLGLNVGRLKIAQGSQGGGASLAMVQLASCEEASFAILALDGEDGTSLFEQMRGAASSGDAAQAAGEGMPGEGGLSIEEFERFRAQYPMDERAFDYIQSSPIEVQRHFMATFKPPAVQEDYSRIVTTHVRYCLRQHEDYTARQNLEAQFGGGSAPQDQLDEFCARFPMDARARDYLRVAPLAVQEEVLSNFTPAAEEKDFSRMVTAHIKFCMKLLRPGSPQAALVRTPSAEEAVVSEGQLAVFLQRFPMDEQAFDYLKISPPEVQIEVIRNFRPQAEESDYSRMVTAHINFCMKQLRGGLPKAAPALSHAEAAVPEERLEEFLGRFPMDSQAFDYLKISPPAVQLQVLGNFRPSAEDSDYSKMVTAYINRCMKQLREGSLRTALAPVLSQADVAVPEEQLEAFLGRFPMDTLAFDYLKISPPAVQRHVLSSFRPQAEESDYSRMVTAYIKRCTTQLREGSLKTALAPIQSEEAVPEEQLEAFLGRFPMDSQAFDYLKISPPAVQRQVLSSFRPQAEESDYSKMVTAYINVCTKHLRGATAFAPSASSAPPRIGQYMEAAGAAAPAGGSTIDDWAAQLEHFRASFPMDERAFDYLIMAPPAVQERVVSTFRPQAEESDYSRMITAHIRHCLKQAGGDVAAHGGGGSAEAGCLSDGDLERFLASFPMDARAFDTLRAAPAQVQERVIKTFRPQSEEQDYSRMVMGHVKFCMKHIGEPEADAADPTTAEWGEDGAPSSDALENFRANFPMDDRAFEYLQVSSPSVQLRVLSTFRPKAEESDYSKMVTAHVRYCRTQAQGGTDTEPQDGAASSRGGRGLRAPRQQLSEAREAGGDAGAHAAGHPRAQEQWGSNGGVSYEALGDFAMRFPMDDWAYDYLQKSPAEVQARVISTFKPQAEEADYSKMVTAHVKHCLRLFREAGGDAAPRSDAVSFGAEQPSVVAERGEAGAMDGGLEQFRAKYPMDDRAFEYLQTSDPEVQARVVSTFRAKSEEWDYSRMVTAHVKYCRGQHREGSGRGWPGAESRPTPGNSGSGGVSSQELDQFRSTYPMDDRAFDYLQVSPAEVQTRVVRTFKPARQEADYSRMITGHVRYCLRQHRDGGGGW